MTSREQGGRALTSHDQGGRTMTSTDPVLTRLAELSGLPPPAELSRKLTTSGHARLVPARVHPVWSVAVAASVLVYLGWALQFTSHLF
jgi:hypothetical protein